MKNIKERISFSKKYTFALSLIALLALLAYVNLTTIIDAQKNDGNKINMSGKQRMLSQKIALYSVKYEFDKLENIIEQMSASHKKLLSIEMSDEIKKVYYSKPIMLDDSINIYLEQAKEFIKTNDKKNLDFILKDSETILKKLDIAVSIYQEEAERKIQNLQKNEFYIILLTLLTLLTEALFIFRPIDKNVKKYTKELLLEKEYSDMITQTNTNGIIVVDKNFKILTFNQSAEKMFGYSADEMIFTTLLDDRIIPKKYLDGHISGLKNFMKSGKLKN